MRSSKSEKAIPYTALDLLVLIYRMVIVALSHMLFLGPLLLGYLLPKHKYGRLKIWFHAIRFFSKIILYLSGAVKGPFIGHTENQAIYLFDSETLWGPLVLYAKKNAVINLEHQNEKPGRLVDLFFGLPQKLSRYFITTEGICQNEVLSEIPVSVVCFSQPAIENQTNYPQIDETIIHIASEFHMDVVPVFLTGIGTGLNTQSSFSLSGNVSIGTAHPVSYHDILELLPTNQTDAVNKKIRNEFEQFHLNFRNPGQLRKYLLRNFIYKGPVLEWYMRIKIRLENSYRLFHEILPKEGTMTDIGCGYGAMTYMLGLLSPERKIYGIDYDEKKILVANHCYAKANNINFMHGDVQEIDLPQSHVFILSDVLHYLPYQEQEKIISKCAEKLIPGGKIVIREADKELQSRHVMTRLSEFLSTRLGFNKTQNEKGILYFPKGAQIQELLTEHGLDVKVIDNTRITSNLIIIAKHKDK
jgi:2-polyprenyl-3-methyl-5-hydroxy-6-metoxy-1,4-benzoquinol methylase